MRAAILLVLGLVGFSTVAQADECFRTSYNVRWDVAGDDLIVRTRGARYRLTFDYCNDLNWAHDFQFETFPPNSLNVCRGDNVLLLDTFDRPFERCRIRTITRIQ